MSITSVKGLKVWIEKAGITTTDVVPTAISKANPTEITVASTAGLSDGDMVLVTGTDYPELDDKTFVISGIAAGGGTKFTLLGADTSATAGTTIGGSAKIAAYIPADMQNICLSSIDISPGTPNTIDISTFCNPGASLPGNPTPGTVTLNGFVDIGSAGYKELLLAEADGKARLIKLDIPNQGYLIGKLSIGSVSWGVPIEGSSTFAANATMSVPMRHVFA